MDYLNWRHVLTKQNTGNSNSRSCCGVKLQLKWLNWPELLFDEKKWQENVQTYPSEKSDKKTKTFKTLSRAIYLNYCQTKH